jgi:hypothetical protein
MANDPNSLLNDGRCLICEGAGFGQTMSMRLMANIISNGGVVPAVPCVDPGTMVLSLNSADATTLDFAVGMPIPGPTVGFIMKWGTTAGGPYPNSKSFGLVGAIQVTTADGLVAGTQYYFIVYGNNGNGCISATASNELASALTHPSATAWKNAVIAAGGGTPSSSIVAAYSVFFYGLDADGFTYSGASPDIVFYNALYPTSIIGAMIPQIDASGVAWTNRNFVLADLTVNGLKGNGTNKSIGTGYLSQTYWTDISAGLSAMVSLAAAENTYDMGIGGNNVNSQFGLECNWSDTKTYFECWRFDAPNLITGTPPASPTVGFWCANRTSANAGAMYFAKTGSPIASIGTMAGAQNGAANMGGVFTLELFAINSTGTIGSWSTKRLSMVAGHKGFTLAQATKLFNRSQTLRTALGGGSV